MDLHGYYPATHDWLTNFPGSYYKAIEALYHLQKAKIRTGISTTIHQKNWKEVHKILEIASDLGISDWFVFRFVKIGRAITEIEAIDITPEQHKAVFEKVKQLSTNLGVTIRYNSEAPYVIWGTDEVFSPCKAGREIGVITATGDVLACTGMRLPELICGNIYQQSFRDIWFNSPTLQKLRSFYNNFNEQIQGHCKKCQYLSICHAGCRLLAFLDCGYLTGSDPGCWIQRSSS
jgi:pyrroloquinoline quinone biosynthesis protein E